MDTNYLVIVTPADGWGAPWYEMYRTKNNAEKRVYDLAKKYQMELEHNAEGLRAERFGCDYDMKHRIAEVTITHMYYND